MIITATTCIKKIKTLKKGFNYEKYGITCDKYSKIFEILVQFQILTEKIEILISANHLQITNFIFKFTLKM